MQFFQKLLPIIEQSNAEVTLKKVTLKDSLVVAHQKEDDFGNKLPRKKIKNPIVLDSESVFSLKEFAFYERYQDKIARAKAWLKKERIKFQSDYARSKKFYDDLRVTRRSLRSRLTSGLCRFAPHAWFPTLVLSSQERHMLGAMKKYTSEQIQESFDNLQKRLEQYDKSYSGQGAGAPSGLYNFNYIFTSPLVDFLNRF